MLSTVVVPGNFCYDPHLWHFYLVSIGRQDINLITLSLRKESKVIRLAYRVTHISTKVIRFFTDQLNDIAQWGHGSWIFFSTVLANPLIDPEWH